MTNLVSQPQDQILPARPDYAGLCLIFLKQAEGVDQQLVDALHIRRQGVAFDSDEGRAIGQVVVEHERYNTTALTLATKQYGWKIVARVLPGAFAQAALQSVDDLTERHADARAALMLNFLSAPKVAEFFPTSLLSEEAAGYMRERQRGSLVRVIEGALGTVRCLV
jgi:hypothetical protein